MFLLHTVVFIFLYFSFSFGLLPNEDPNLFEGDIVLDPDQRKAVENNGHVFAATNGKLWPPNIPYEFSPELQNDAKIQEGVRLAFEHYKKHTCLRFKKRTHEKQYIYFRKGRSCSSHIGANGGVRNIDLNSSCNKWGVIVHELMHAIGFWHEQSRPDRDQYVTIIWDNLSRKARVNFKKYGRDRVDSLGVPYDLKSIMHYSESAWTGSKDRISIKTKDPKLQHLIRGDRTSNGFSELDIKQIRLLYKCNGNQPVTGKPTVYSCVDYYDNCQNYDHYCKNSPGTATRKWMEKDCRKTCGFCS